MNSDERWLRSASMEEVDKEKGRNVDFVSLCGYKMLILMITNHMFWINKELYIMFL